MAAQAARDQAGLVPELVDHLLHPYEVLSATPYRPLITLETVATDTPAVRATSWIFTRCTFGHAGTVPVENVIEND